MDTTTLLAQPDVASWVRSRLRNAGSLNFSANRETGVSSNAMVDYALGGDFPRPDDFPCDAGDLNACRNARSSAPEALHALMDEVLSVYVAELGAAADGPVPDGLRISDFDSTDELAARLSRGNG